MQAAVNKRGFAYRFNCNNNYWRKKSPQSLIEKRNISKYIFTFISNNLRRNNNNLIFDPWWVKRNPQRWAKELPVYPPVALLACWHVRRESRNGPFVKSEDKKRHELTIEIIGKYECIEPVEMGEIKTKSSLKFRAFAVLHSEKRRANDRIVICVSLLPLSSNHFPCFNSLLEQFSNDCRK